MATKIRLARHGKKGKPVFHIVIAESRSPRDGRFIKKIGVYNPTSNPATIDINFNEALAWLEKG
ncbi:MAG TPA: 30S ribosomal protein S16, partial [Flavobacteriales bacterium]|nr:30S ribosomal protein S16 [Flavobacteriales bacterium]